MIHDRYLEKNGLRKTTILVAGLLTVGTSLRLVQFGPRPCPNRHLDITWHKKQLLWQQLYLPVLVWDQCRQNPNGLSASKDRLLSRSVGGHLVIGMPQKSFCNWLENIEFPLHQYYQWRVNFLLQDPCNRRCHLLPLSSCRWHPHWSCRSDSWGGPTCGISHLVSREWKDIRYLAHHCKSVLRR